jgi:hypothetical protein
MFMDLQAVSNVVVTGFNAATLALPNASFQVQVFTRNGSTLGGTSSTGPTSSSAGWTLHATVAGTQGATGQVSLPLVIPDLPINAGQTIGIGLVFVNIGQSYVGAGVSTPATYTDSILRLTTGEVKAAPFTTSGAYFVSRELLGNIFYRSDAVFRNGFE